MRGWAIEVGGTFIDEFENPVIGIACDGSFPEPARVLHIVSQAPGDAVIVVRESDKVAREVLDSIGMEYVVAGLCPWWKREEKLPIHGPLLPGARRKFSKDVIYDFRSRNRIFEMLYGCTEILWFKDVNSKTSDFDVEVSPRAKVYRIEGGKKKRRKKT